VQQKKRTYGSRTAVSLRTGGGRVAVPAYGANCPENASPQTVIAQAAIRLSRLTRRRQKALASAGRHLYYRERAGIMTLERAHSPKSRRRGWGS